CCHGSAQLGFGSARLRLGSASARLGFGFGSAFTGFAVGSAAMSSAGDTGTQASFLPLAALPLVQCLPPRIVKFMSDFFNGRALSILQRPPTILYSTLLILSLESLAYNYVLARTWIDNGNTHEIVLAKLSKNIGDKLDKEKGRRAIVAPSSASSHPRPSSRAASTVPESSERSNSSAGSEYATPSSIPYPPPPPPQGYAGHTPVYLFSLSRL
ncbi:hypothetical protein M405DRAFT_847946, partial [Rhizopogon salebrosus TDB-379]